MSKVREERIKLLASYFNIAGAGSFIASVITEPLAYLTSGRVDAFILSGFMLIWFAGSAALHLAAQWILGRLEP